jgi:hypothetical protein
MHVCSFVVSLTDDSHAYPTTTTCFTNSDIGHTCIVCVTCQETNSFPMLCEVELFYEKLQSYTGKTLHYSVDATFKTRTRTAGWEIRQTHPRSYKQVRQEICYKVPLPRRHRMFDIECSIATVQHTQQQGDLRLSVHSSCSCASPLLDLRVPLAAPLCLPPQPLSALVFLGGPCASSSSAVYWGVPKLA